SALMHLGMSGSLRLAPGGTPVRAHDHFDLVLDDGRALRFNDPRRFGCLLWQPPDEVHPLLRSLGPEPLADGFDGDWLWTLSRGRDRKSTRLNSSHVKISYAVFCLKKKRK